MELGKAIAVGYLITVLAASLLLLAGCTGPQTDYAATAREIAADPSLSPAQKQQLLDTLWSQAEAEAVLRSGNQPAPVYIPRQRYQQPQICHVLPGNPATIICP